MKFDRYKSCKKSTMKLNSDRIMQKISNLVFLAVIGVASASVCCPIDKMHRKPPQKSTVDRENIRNIVQQLERINKIDWKALTTNRYLKNIKITFAGFETDIIYIINLLDGVSQNDWKEYQTLLERRRLSSNEQGMNRGRELAIIHIIQILEGASETIWKTFGKLLRNNNDDAITLSTSTTNTATSKNLEAYEVNIDGKRINMLKIIDRLVRFSGIDWKKYETQTMRTLLTTGQLV